jgi:hypothetical protein
MALGWPGLLLVTASARADVVRYALVVGQNLGNADEVPLLYAEDDALRIRRVLTATGGVTEDQATLLLSPTRNQLLHALAAIKEAVENDRAAGRDSLVVFFYSGHAGGDGLHLNGRALRWTELQTLLDRTEADVRVAFLDACQSGTMTGGVRAKGASRAPSFAVELTDTLTASGQVVLASSAADQLSHESDAIAGSYFTHHLASALSGAADQDQDGMVTLSEAWRHVARETSFQTREQRAGSQTPTYSWELSGTGDLVLTRPGDSAASLRFPAGLTGSFAIFDVDRRAFVAQVNADGEQARDLGVPMGEYIVQQRLPDHLEVFRVTLTDGQQAMVGDEGFAAVSYDEDDVKGAIDARARAARRPELVVAAVAVQRWYGDPADDVLEIPATSGLGLGGRAHWAAGPWVGAGLSRSRGQGAVQPDVSESVGMALADTVSIAGGWSTPPRLFRAGVGLHLTHLGYQIDYADYDVGGPQTLRTLAPGLGVFMGVHPSRLTVEVGAAAHEVRYWVDEVPSGVRFADLTLRLGARF